MCRIYGHFNAVVSPEELDAVSALQRHGGPDASGIRQGNTWSLGSNRLAIMDPDGGRQPYELPDGTVIVVFNGEIYNHAELRGQLRRRGYEFTDHCDGSILPALYHCYGDRFAEHIDGMYAIAVLDLRAGPRLLLATDHLAMKPVYYSWHPGRKELYFSSEIPSLLAFSAVSGRRWAPGLNAYLATKTPFGERTMFADVRVLPPAAIAICDPVSGLRIHRSPPRQLAADDVRAALRQETGALLAADVPVATITSGGLDSSLVTAFAAEKNPELHTFNIAYTGSWPGDERHFARQVARRAGATYHQVEINPVTFPDLLPDVVWHLGQPNADPITLSTYALFAAVHDAGFKVALTGDGADEVFGGYGRMRAAAEAAAAGRPWEQAYLDELSAVPARLRARLYTGAYAAEVAAEPPVPTEAMRMLYQGDGTVLDRITSFELEYRLPAYHLRRVDHLSMAHAVEVRLPFCQRRIFGLGRELADWQRIGPAGVKLSLYQAAAGLLPPDVLARPKQPFTLPVTAMLTPGWPLWEYARDMLAPARLRGAGEIDPRPVEALFAAQAVRPGDTTALAIWALLVHQIWCEQVSRLTASRSLTKLAS
jgi:asparagine synthase (glutamine-hydrolysing)